MSPSISTADFGTARPKSCTAKRCGGSRGGCAQASPGVPNRSGSAIPTGLRAPRRYGYGCPKSYKRLSGWGPRSRTRSSGIIRPSVHDSGHGITGFLASQQPPEERPLNRPGMVVTPVEDVASHRASGGSCGHWPGRGPCEPEALTHVIAGTAAVSTHSLGGAENLLDPRLPPGVVCGLGWTTCRVSATLLTGPHQPLNGEHQATPSIPR